MNSYVVFLAEIVPVSFSWSWLVLSERNWSGMNPSGPFRRYAA